MPKFFPGILLTATVLSGCRCSPSEDSLPGSRNVNPAAVRGGCPAVPAWSGNRGDEIELEVLHSNKSNGVGYRLFKDGHLETYDEVTIGKDDAGRMKMNHVPGTWRNRGPVAAEGIETARKAVAAADPTELVGARVGAGSNSALTYFLVWRDGKKQTFCSYGEQAPAGLRSIEQSAHNLLRYVAEAGRGDLEIRD